MDPEVTAVEGAVAATPPPAEVEQTQEQTASPESEESALAKAPKGVGKRIDELTRNWRQTERDRDHWREMALRAQAQPQMPAQPVQQQAEQPPTLEAFNYDQEAYTKAAIRYEAQQILKQEREAQAQQQRVAEERQRQQTFASKVDKAVEKNPDYHEVVGNPTLAITQHMAETILLLDNGPDVAYHLGRNPEEALRIAQMPPMAAAAALGRLEARLATPAVQTTKAPAPVPTVGGGGVTAQKSLSEMTPAEFRDFRNAQERKRG